MLWPAARVSSAPQSVLSCATDPDSRSPAAALTSWRRTRPGSFGSTRCGSPAGFSWCFSICARGITASHGASRRPLLDRTPPSGQPRPLPPLEEVLEAGHVLALNFPVAINPAWQGRRRDAQARFPAFLLQRIPKIAAHPDRTWRDLLFICDEYHVFATVGETDPTGSIPCDPRCRR
jgi:hypothetical protein